MEKLVSIVSNTTDINQFIFNLNHNLTPASVQDQYWSYFYNTADIDAGNLRPDLHIITALDWANQAHD